MLAVTIGKPMTVASTDARDVEAACTALEDRLRDLEKRAAVMLS
jgi:hypothetical protein